MPSASRRRRWKAARRSAATRARLLPVTDAVKAVAAGRRASFIRDETVDGVHLRVLTRRGENGEALQIARPLTEADATLGRLRWVLGAVMLGGVGLAAGARPGRLAGGDAPARAVDRDGRAGDRHRGAAPPASRPAPKTSRAGWPRRSTPCCRPWRARAMRSASSSPTPRTSCARRSRRSGPTSSCSSTRRSWSRRSAPRCCAPRATSWRTSRCSSATSSTSRGRASARAEPPEELRLDELVGAAVERARRHAPAMTFTLEAEPSVVVGCRARLARAVGNLLDNAVKWSPPDATVEVTRRRRRGDRARPRARHRPGRPAACL